jgi:hypothetical protein
MLSDRRKGLDFIELPSRFFVHGLHQSIASKRNYRSCRHELTSLGSRGQPTQEEFHDVPQPHAIAHAVAIAAQGVVAQRSMTGE